jgi:hypothetical protein
MTLDTKALEAACRLAAKRDAMRFKTIDEALEYEERCWRRHRDEVEPIVEAYLSHAAAQKVVIGFAAFRDGKLLPQSVTTNWAELQFEATGEWVGCELRAIYAEAHQAMPVLGDADDPESLSHALEIVSLGDPYTDIQGQLYGNPLYSPDGFRDAEFRDYGLARAVRIICNNAAAIRALVKP